MHIRETETGRVILSIACGAHGSYVSAWDCTGQAILMLYSVAPLRQCVRSISVTHVPPPLPPPLRPHNVRGCFATLTAALSLACVCFPVAPEATGIRGSLFGRHKLSLSGTWHARIHIAHALVGKLSSA
ncbi:hypothetical protein CBL_05756 [Carabus blaptoides fortunei]